MNEEILSLYLWDMLMDTSTGYIFAADDVVQVNKMMRRWKTKYADLIEDIQIHEELMAIRSSRFLNPDFKQEIDDIL